MSKYVVNTLNDLKKAAEWFIQNHLDKKLFALHGKMGVGKTTFVKTICESLGVKDNISSPSFSIVNEYTTLDGQLIYHFDMYRIEDIQEALDFGIEEYLYSNHICFIEWPEKILEILPENIISVNLEDFGEEKRIITVQ